ncbi:MAG: hypothetical protein MK098_07000 [Marinovum sp.]|nr:hypothetical protein [Marinovum sp.]
MRYRTPRRPSDRPIKVTWVKGESPATVRNYSQTGVCIGTDNPLPRGTRILITLLHNAWVAKVAWTRDGMMGAQFDRPLSQQEMGLMQLKGNVSQYASWRRNSKTTARAFRELR